MGKLVAGPLGGEFSGRVGNAVFLRTAHGTVIREYAEPANPQSPAQRAVRAAQGRASRAWSEMEPSAVALWTAWAKTQPHPRPSPRGGGTMQPNNAFGNLYKVLLRLDPSAPVPLVPPARPFFGDTTIVDLRFSIDDLGRPTSFGSGVVVFGASAPNASGMVTELLLQPLASRNRRTYRERYRHAAFVAFSGPLTASVQCEAGWVACAYRFVNAIIAMGAMARPTKREP